MHFRYPTQILWENEGWWLFEADSIDSGIAIAQQRYPAEQATSHLQVMHNGRWHFADAVKREG